MYNSACPIQGVSCRPPRVRYNSFLPMYTATFITVCSGQYWTSDCLAPSSTYRDLICDFFSSGRGFARFGLVFPPKTSGFLQIPSRDGHPCLRLTLPTAKCVADFHRQAITHARYTKKTAPNLLQLETVNDKVFSCYSASPR
jgi:hypothetical protein